MPTFDPSKVICVNPRSQGNRVAIRFGVSFSVEPRTGLTVIPARCSATNGGGSGPRFDGNSERGTATPERQHENFKRRSSLPPAWGGVSRRSQWTGFADLVCKAAIGQLLGVDARQISF